MPGRVLGMYTVTGQSQSNTCGLGAPDPWKFTVQLSLDGSTLYWSWLDGSPLLSGSTSSSGKASLTNTQQINADSTDAGLGPCTLVRDDDLEIDLATGTTPASFTGTISYTYTPTTGSSCTDVLGSSGGSFSNLPCAVSYGVTAARN